MEIIVEKECHFLIYGEKVTGGILYSGMSLCSKYEIKTFENETLFKEEVDKLKSEGKEVLISQKSKNMDDLKKRPNINRQRM
jgi:hypothetical protein